MRGKRYSENEQLFFDFLCTLFTDIIALLVYPDQLRPLWRTISFATLAYPLIIYQHPIQIHSVPCRSIR